MEEKLSKICGKFIKAWDHYRSDYYVYVKLSKIERIEYNGFCTIAKSPALRIFVSDDIWYWVLIDMEKLLIAINNTGCPND